MKLLINPWIYDFSAYDMWLMPVGLLRFAAGLVKQGHKLIYYDCLGARKRDDDYGCGKYFKVRINKPEELKNINKPYFRYGIELVDFVRFIKETKRPDEVFVGTGMTYWYPGVFEAIRIIRKEWGDIRITIGGIYAKLCREHAEKYSRASCIDNSVISMDYPAWDLLKRHDALVIQTSYGCPHNCSYCGSKNLFNGFIQRDYVEVLDEIEYYINKYNTADFVFYDDALLADSDRHIKPILNEIKRRKISRRFHVPNALHARFIDRETALLLKETGFKVIRLGLETSGIERHDSKVSNEEFLEAVSYLKEAGFTGKEILAYTIFGSPFDGPDDVLRDIDFVTDVAGVTIKICDYSLVPGSPDSKKFNIPDNLDPLRHNNSVFPLMNNRYSVEKIRELRLLASNKNKNILCRR